MRPFVVLSFICTAVAVVISGQNGPYEVSISAQSLTDRRRIDPYAPPDHPHLRNLMTSLFIPVNATSTSCQQHTIPYMTPAVAADYDFLAISMGLPNGTFESLQLETCQAVSPCRCGCARKKQSQTFPLVLFSPGFGQSRLLYSVMAKSLASHGYIVVTVDHPYDASVVEFPDGTVVRNANISTDDDKALEQVTLTRAADVSFVIDELQSPTTFRPALARYGAVANFSQILMFGHSLGGASSATTMLSDTRILGGVDMDGKFFNPALNQGLDRPFLLLGRPDHKAEDETWDIIWPRLRSARIEMAIRGTTHGSFTDFPVLLDHMDIPSAMRSEINKVLGNISGDRMGAALVEILCAFSDFVFGRSIPELLQTGKSKVPEITVLAADL